MSDDQKPQRWWQTIPGMFTAAAALITAITGLVAALHQAGVFSSNTTREALQPGGSEMIVDSGAPAHPAESVNSSEDDNPAVYPLKLKLNAEETLGTATFKILSAQVEQHNREKLALRITLRMTNNNDYPANFWDNSFRLLLDNVPRSPESGLNLVVDGNSAKEGDVVFLVPVVTQSAVLRIRQGDEATDILVDLSH